MDLIPLFLLKNHAESFSTKGLFSTFLIFYCDKEAFHETIQLFENNWTLLFSHSVMNMCVGLKYQVHATDLYTNSNRHLNN